MKVFKLFLFISLLPLSCKKKEETKPAQTNTPTPSPSTSGTYYLFAKIDGVDYNADAIRVSASADASKIKIVSALSDGRNFEIVLNDPSGAGTYSYPTPSGSSYSLKLVFDDGSSATSVFSTGACTGTSGTLTIATLSTSAISGAFKFTAQKAGSCTLAAKNVTGGGFRSQLIQ